MWFIFLCLCSRRLYTHLRAGTKRLIEEYISEVVRALQLVCVTESAGGLPSVQQEGDDADADGTEQSDDCSRAPTTAEKLSFFNETRHAFGRSALLLSGGATLGLYHIGVMKALHDCNLLPRVLSGSSVGSIIVAMVGTRSDEDLIDLFDPDGTSIKLNFFVSATVQTTQSVRVRVDFASLLTGCCFLLRCSVCVFVASQRWQRQAQIHASVHARSVDGH